MPALNPRGVCLEIQPRPHSSGVFVARLGFASRQLAFLSNVRAFWPRRADNYDGLLVAHHESASFGDPDELAVSVRDRYHGYTTWSDTTHCGVYGATRDVRAELWRPSKFLPE